MKFNKDTKIGEILQVAPEKAEILIDCGMHCIGCPASQMETLEEACDVHGIDVEEVIKKLDLKNVKIVHGRAEEVARNAEYREQYDVVVSRAVANLHVLLEYDIGYAKINGRLLLMKSGNVEEEIKLATKAMSALKCKVVKKYEYKYVVNKEEYTRCILEIMKKEKTLEKYPRNYGQITKKPLL